MHFGGPEVNCGPIGGQHGIYPLRFTDFRDARGNSGRSFGAYAEIVAQPQAMTDAHVVSALKEKRIQVASQIESLQGQLRQAVMDLDHVEAARQIQPGR